MTVKSLEKIKRGFTSLRMRFIAVFLLAAVLALICYFIANITINGYIDNVYLSDENKAKRETEYHSDLQRYINDSGITFDTIDRVSEWARQNQYVYILIYKEQTDDEAFFIPDDMVDKLPETQPPSTTPETPDEGDGTEEKPDLGDTGTGEAPEEGEEGTEAGTGTTTGGTAGGDDDTPIGGITISWPTRSELEEIAKSRDMLFVELPNNQYVYVKFAEYTEYLYYDISNLVSLGFAALVVLVILLLYITRLTRRISRLGSDVTIVAAGDTDRHISVRGEDEISELASNVETMRATIVENYKKEKEALDSNTALITSMSHDIRTPLTVLLGYMDVMRACAGDDEQMQGYIRAAENTAMRLKKLSDDMFAYFLVFGREESAARLEIYDALTILEQMLAEHALLLRESGYILDEQIDADALAGLAVRTDAQGLIRIFDNVFSNIYKYADQTKPVTMKITAENGKILVFFSNVTRTDGERVESNGIGLKTCKKLAEQMNAEFVAESEENVFNVKLTLPCEV